MLSGHSLLASPSPCASHCIYKRADANASISLMSTGAGVVAGGGGGRGGGGGASGAASGGGGGGG